LQLPKSENVRFQQNNIAIVIFLLNKKRLFPGRVFLSVIDTAENAAKTMESLKTAVAIFFFNCKIKQNV